MQTESYKSSSVLIHPEKIFVDKHERDNYYRGMNPAIFFDDGKDEWTVLVRGVNYDRNKHSFIMNSEFSNSVYWIGIGKDYKNILFYDLKIDYGNLNIFESYWKGVEDIRFIDKNHVIVCVPELSPMGEPTLFKATLCREKKKIHSFVSLFPNCIEKNWMPFQEDKVIYSCSPFKIKSLVEEEYLTEIENTNLEGYHGSTNGINISETIYLFLIHKKQKNNVTNRWLWFNTKLKEVITSEDFVFFPDSFIEFPCSLVKIEENIFISLGVNDRYAVIIKKKCPETPDFI